MKNIAAFTELDNVPYPGYVSINEQDDGRITLTARERGNGGQKVVVIEIPRDALTVFAAQLEEHV
jgi:hypothetical protein